ncbi:MAG: putative ATP-grasp-modified RiPP, partial [Actinomycetes bacterium]
MAVRPLRPGRRRAAGRHHEHDPRSVSARESRPGVGPPWRWSGGFCARCGADGDVGESTGDVGAMAMSRGRWPPGVAPPAVTAATERSIRGESPSGKGYRMPVTIEKFAGDPLAPVSGQLALHGSTFTERREDEPSPVGVRPWGLRRARPATGPGRVLPAWRYDEREQVAVEIASGLPLIVAGDPSADTTSTTDGEDPPSSEDWDNVSRTADILSHRTIKIKCYDRLNSGPTAPNSGLPTARSTSRFALMADGCFSNAIPVGNTGGSKMSSACRSPRPLQIYFVRCSRYDDNRSGVAGTGSEARTTACRRRRVERPCV